jgi:Membrane carboxypeptidase/penicillin-binding protein
MKVLGDITQAEYDDAMQAPLNIVAGQGLLRYKVDADYAAEQVREIMVARFGESAYTDGYKVYTTLHDRDQKAGVDAVRAGVLAYDQRHGWRGPQARIDLPAHDADALGVAVKALKPYDAAGSLHPAVVLHASPKLVEAVLESGNTVELSGDACASPLRACHPKPLTNCASIVAPWSGCRSWPRAGASRRCPMCSRRWCRSIRMTARCAPGWAASTTTTRSSIM